MLYSFLFSHLVASSISSIILKTNNDNLVIYISYSCNLPPRNPVLEPKKNILCFWLTSLTYLRPLPGTDPALRAAVWCWDPLSSMLPGLERIGVPSMLYSNTPPLPTVKHCRHVPLLLNFDPFLFQLGHFFA